MPVKIKVTASQMLHRQTIEVKGTGPYRAAHEFVVYFTRKGKVSGGYQFKPTPERYLNIPDIPVAVVEAALQVYRQHSA